jgi:hypothetical protein
MAYRAGDRCWKKVHFLALAGKRVWEELPVKMGRWLCTGTEPLAPRGERGGSEASKKRDQAQVQRLTLGRGVGRATSAHLFYHFAHGLGDDTQGRCKLMVCQQLLVHLMEEYLYVLSPQGLYRAACLQRRAGRRRGITVLLFGRPKTARLEAQEDNHA